MSIAIKVIAAQIKNRFLFMANSISLTFFNFSSEIRRFRSEVQLSGKIKDEKILPLESVRTGQDSGSV